LMSSVIPLTSFDCPCILGDPDPHPSSPVPLVELSQPYGQIPQNPVFLICSQEVPPMKTPNFQELVYNDPIEDLLSQKSFDDSEDYDDLYDDQSFGALLESSNDF